jgi:large subunit ribosomal protein L17
MRHRVRKTTLGRAAGPRKALLKTEVEQVLRYEQITTTLAKAKALRPLVERMITMAKRGDLASQRQLIAALPTITGVNKTLKVLAVRFKERAGGYTRVIKLGKRPGDAANMAILQILAE